MSNRYVVVSGAFFGVIAVFQAVLSLNQWTVNVQQTCKNRRRYESAQFIV
jgi:hypothetical protein